MRIVKLQAENIKRLKAIEVVPDPEKGLVIISGANDMGKTSLLDSIWFGLGGKRAIQTKPIREGQEKASVKIDLGDYLVERIWKGENTYLKVQNKEGVSFPSPQALLDKLIGDLTFDPLAFAISGREDQIKTLQGVIDLPFDAEDFKKAVEAEAEVDVGAGNPLEIIRQTYQSVFDTRTQVGRELKNAAGAWESLGAPEEKIEAVSVTELFDQRKRLEKKQSHRARLVETIDKLEMELADKAQTRTDLIREILEHKQAIQEAEGYLKNLVTTTKVTEETLAIKRSELPIPIDFTEIEERIALADETNSRARSWKAKQEAGQLVEKLDTQRKELTERLKAIEDYRDGLVAKADMPVDGLGFNGGGITYNGIPFEQVGSAMQLRISTAVAMTLNPTLRVLRITDGSLLDSENLKMLEEMAGENDYQIWIEIVDESGKVGVYIEDGRKGEK